jgi:prepilin peptidase CpaA
MAVITVQQLILLSVLLILAVIFDLRERRIPNLLTFSYMAGGLAYHFAVEGFAGLIFCVQGLVLGMALLILFYAAGGMGAGDVKLMGAVGCLLGPVHVFYSFIFSALVGGLCSIVVLYRFSVLRSSLERCVSAPVDFLRTGYWYWSPSPAEKKIPRLCYAVAISLGTGIQVLRSL